MGQYFESHCRVGSLHDLYNPLMDLLRPLHKPPSVSAIGPDLLQTWKPICEFLKHQLPPISILDIRWVNDAVQDQAKSIDDDMPLPALDFLPCIVAFGAPFSVVFAL